MHLAMSRLSLLLLLATTASIAAPSAADACDRALDNASPPATERSYDADRSPAAPKFVDAFIDHQYEGAGCGMMSSCGDFHSLSLTVQVEPNAQNVLLRITDEDKVAIFAKSSADDTGMMHVVLGYSELYRDVDLQIAVINNGGYPSLEVSGLAYNSGDQGAGCTLVGDGNKNGMLLVFFAAMALMGWRRRRT